MARWGKTEHKLKETHGWRCRPGYQIFVADRGAVRFDIPQGWIIQPQEGGSIQFYDKQPPDETCRLEMSLIRIGPYRVDFSGLPLAKLLVDVLTERERDPTILSRTEVKIEERTDLEFAWLETKYLDPGENREAFTRTCIARFGNIHTLITLDFWPEDAPRLRPVWKEVLRSLQMGQHYESYNGPILH